MSRSAPISPPHPHDIGAPTVRPVVPHADSDKRTGVETCKNAVGYLAVICATVVLTTAALRLWRADLRVPLYDLGDNLMAQMFVKNILESGWIFDNGRLGAPGALDLRDYPIPDALHVAVIKLLGCVCHDSGVVLNLYYLLAFPLIAASAYFVLRRLRLGRFAALVPSVLFACMPYHFLRLPGHLFLAAYYMLPLVTWVCLRVCLGRNPFLQADPGGGRPRWRFMSWEAAGAALVCVLTGLAGVYYAFFSCFLLLAAGCKAAFRERRWAPLAASALLILLVAGSVAAALSPSFVQIVRYGKNPAVAARRPAEADYYGLHFSEMVLPIQGHRLAFLAQLERKFLLPPRQPSFAAIATALGFLGSLGFLYLLGRSLLRRREKTERIEDGLAFLNLAAMMLGAVGGLGSCFAFYVTPAIRCYDRLCIFVAFFALAGLFLALQRLVGRYARGRWTYAACAAGLGALLLLGGLDQTTAYYIPPYAVNKKQYASDADFARRIESALPAGSMVYQMPYMPFPEHGSLEQLTDYELLRPFLHTRTLRWSYGAMKARETSAWQAEVAAQPLPDAVERLAFAGFRGIYLDRAGFADFGAATEAELTRLLGAAPMVSLSGRQTFFDMTAYVETLRGRFTDEEWEGKRKSVLVPPIAVTWTGAFSDLESGPAGDFRWCGGWGELYIANPQGQARRVALKMNCQGWAETPVHLVINGDLFHGEMSLTREAQSLEMNLIVPPGERVLTFACDGPPMPAPNDPREFVFRVTDFQMQVEQ